MHFLIWSFFYLTVHIRHSGRNRSLIMGLTVHWILCIFLLTFLSDFTTGDATKTTRRPRKYKYVNKTLRWTTDEFQKAALDKINEFRAKHNAEPLTLDPILSWDGEEYAKKIGEHCEALGSCKPFYSHTKLTGECVWVSETETSVAGDIPVQAWYEEGKNHDFSHNVFSYTTSQFTQLIWKGTKQVGIGFAVSPVKKYLAVVARFKPNGNWNYIKSFADNVEAEKAARRRRRRRRAALRKHPQSFKGDYYRIFS